MRRPKARRDGFRRATGGIHRYPIVDPEGDRVAGGIVFRKASQQVLAGVAPVAIVCQPALLDRIGDIIEPSDLYDVR
eukprot:CAMPEP_0201196266 /NCGR_PEP_ID=MMETSP0851-20130426/152419_1 /ASSEMBLY_ACC=CAM_ASM_000631 /TAXON_ID=183588 /ORGANISM="Pseudo-nitzschia fraudulenta, Strain WWA7" /LENGTH=76 /DNA_ID=CAMNT_0047483205 /DNA_START=652 /DNA_END=878 /DNA_ORIENTATION=+